MARGFIRRAGLQQHAGPRAPSRPAAGGVVGQDDLDVAADFLQRVAVIGPARAAQFAQPVDRPFDLVLGVDHVAPGAQRLAMRGSCGPRRPRRCCSRGPSAASASRRRSPRRPRRPPSARSRIAASRVTPRDTRLDSARVRHLERLAAERDRHRRQRIRHEKAARRPHHRIVGVHLRPRHACRRRSR